MGLSYYFEFHAPAEETPEAFERFLKSVQRYADSVRFKPTAVLNIPFDTQERREFQEHLSDNSRPRASCRYCVVSK